MSEPIFTQDQIAELVGSEMFRSAAPKFSPEVIEAIYAVAHALLNRGDTDEARFILEWLAMAGNRSSGIDEARAYIAMSDGAYDAATCLYSESYRQNPEDPELLLMAFQAAYRLLRQDGLQMAGLNEWMESCRPSVPDSFVDRFDALKALVEADSATSDGASSDTEPSEQTA